MTRILARTEMTSPITNLVIDALNCENCVAACLLNPFYLLRFFVMAVGAITPPEMSDLRILKIIRGNRKDMSSTFQHMKFVFI